LIARDQDSDIDRGSANRNRKGRRVEWADLRAVMCRPIGGSAWAVAGVRGLAIANERLKLDLKYVELRYRSVELPVLAFLGRVGQAGEHGHLPVISELPAGV